MCGEKRRSPEAPVRKRGSPPRVRGEAEGTKVICIGDRITPACAGRSYKKIVGLRDDEDHPRVCGEKFVGLLSHHPIIGSPPRVRGEGYVLTNTF